MTLYDPQAFDHFINSLAGTKLVDQWESRVAKVGDKVFALLNTREGQPAMALKCTEESFEILTSLAGIGQAPYFARRKWVAIQSGAPLSGEELETYLRRSYALVSAGLTKKLRAELGIAG
nr:MmcQ/YjbR family DNA-binding protein [uncultured Gellertiella sp.]